MLPGPAAFDINSMSYALPPAHARVLVIAGDRRYRAVAAALLAQRGYHVAAGSRDEDVVSRAARERADVVVIDASSSLTAAACLAARLSALRPRVAVVAVSDEPDSGLAALPVVSKWGEFEDLFCAIERVDGRRREVGHAVR